ncbi:MAG: hypothetical protein LBN26_06480 [Christensenellaceae bacterium]|jgi:hypothetical protein|nr:hypothetical protein [Christensenellaceae bacterium]
MNMGKKINVGIGFVTGRKSFKNVVKTYIDNWNESDLLDADRFALHLFVAYDLKYSSTKASDYRISDDDILATVDSAHYLGNVSIENEALHLIEKKVITRAEADLIFGEGYAMKRNIVLYFALKNKMDHIIFLDDDEYPIAVINIDQSIVWKGQAVISTHIDNMLHADMTHGHHCGYISPIPHIAFNDDLTEADFKQYIQAISNDIINWESVKEKMDNGGVTFANLDIINSKKVEHVKEINGMKFISGANLGFNLKNIDKIFPFYNPPGARGEDAFLSTSIGECEIRKAPCYTFHDGFGLYEQLLLGVLPNALKTIYPDNGAVTERFLNASIGWIRYKPLLLYILDLESFDAKTMEIRASLEGVIPKICKYFGNDGFEAILREFDFYCENAEKHYQDFKQTQATWIKVVTFLKKDESPCAGI